MERVREAGDIWEFITQEERMGRLKERLSTAEITQEEREQERETGVAKSSSGHE